jgi:hypothetical protein
MTVVDRLTIGGQLLGRFSGLALLEAFDSIDLMAISFPSRTHLWLYSFQRCVAQDEFQLPQQVLLTNVTARPPTPIV